MLGFVDWKRLIDCFVLQDYLSVKLNLLKKSNMLLMLLCCFFFFFSLLNKKQIVWELFMAHFVCFQQMENDYKWYCFLMIYSGYSQMTGLNKSISIIFCCQQPKALISWSPLSSKKPFSAYFSLLPFPDYQNNLLHVFYFHKLFSTFLGMGMRMKWANTEKKE